MNSPQILIKSVRSRIKYLFSFLKIKRSKIIFPKIPPSAFWKNPVNILFFSSFFLLFLSLPGENYYQTLFLSFQKPDVRQLPFSMSPPAPYPLLTGQMPENISSLAAVVMDIPSGTLLFEKNSNLTLTPASTTKIMTALIAIENYPLDKILTVKNLNTNGANMNLEIRDKITVENLLYGLLVASGNDAAYVLADNFKGGIEKFIYSMNNKAKDLNMKNTHFNDVSGLINENHYTTAFDLARLTVYALNNPVFFKIVSIPEITVSNYDFTKWYPLKNVNKLLGEIPGVYGIKTGYTEEAGECLVSAAKRKDKNILAVVLNSEDRFTETGYLLNWAFENFYWQKLR